MNKPETGESVPLRQPDTKCFDCGLPYSDGGFQDLVIPDWAWCKISPYKNEGGLLCPNCINRRLVRMGIRCNGAFMSGNIISVTECNVEDNDNSYSFGGDEALRILECFQAVHKSEQKKENTK